MTEQSPLHQEIGEGLSAARLLQFYVRGGVEVFCGATPRLSPPPTVRSFRDSDARPAPSPSPPSMEPQPSPSVDRGRPAEAADSPNAASGIMAHILTARKAAAAAENLEELEAAVQAFDGCLLKQTALHTVFGTGPAHAELLIVGEAPGDQEDRQGIPFVGASGQLLDKMLFSIGIRRQDVRITNTLFWRPPGNRTPSPEEIALCEPFLYRQIALVRPRMVMALGRSAATTLLETTRPMGALRQKLCRIDKEGLDIPCLCSYHPSYLLRTPLAKKMAWEDFLLLKKTMQSQNPAAGAAT